MSDTLAFLGARLKQAMHQERSVSVRLDRKLPAQETRPRRMPPEYVRLFHAINSLNEQNKPFILQIVSSTNGEGTSRTAAALSQVAARDTVLPVLLVDCSPTPGDASARGGSFCPTLLEAFSIAGTVEAAIQQSDESPRLKACRLTAESDGVLGASPAELQRLFEELRNRFAMVVLDCPPALLNPMSLALARYCDGSALVVRSETTRRASIAETKRLVERYGGQIIGLVLNRKRAYLPGWLHRHL